MALRPRRRKSDARPGDPGDRIFIVEDLRSGTTTYVQVAAADVQQFLVELESSGAEEKVGQEKSGLGSAGQDAGAAAGSKAHLDRFVQTI